MHRQITLIILALIFSLTSVRSEEKGNRRVSIQKSLSDQAALNRQIQLLIFEAFENRKREHSGEAFYNHYYLDTKKFLVGITEREFLGKKALKNMDSLIHSLERNHLKSIRNLNEIQQRAKESTTQKELWKKEVKKHQDVVDLIKAQITGYKSLKKIALTPQIPISDDSLIKFLNKEVEIIASRSGITLQTLEAIASSYDHEMLQKMFQKEFNNKIKSGSIKIIGDKEKLLDKQQLGISNIQIRGEREEFSELYTDVRLFSTLAGKAPDSPIMDPKYAMDLWNEAGQNLARAQKLLAKKKKK